MCIYLHMIKSELNVWIYRHILKLILASTCLSARISGIIIKKDNYCAELYPHSDRKHER